MPDLLYEVGTEELPASYIVPALQQLTAALTSELDSARLEHGGIRTAGTPRRLVIFATGIAERQPDVEQEVVGPPARAGMDAAGKPTKAAEGFARSQGIAVSEIYLRDTGRGQYCCVHKRTPGRPALDVLAEILPRITLAVSFPKSMVWLSGERAFARPVRSILALLDDRIIPVTVVGVESGRLTQRHPILAPGWVEIRRADWRAYSDALRHGCVIVEGSERKEFIRAEIQKALEPFGGGNFREEALLEEVTYLVQYPSVTRGNFDPAFLSVPPPVIEAAMMEHQRYFPVRDAEDRLQPHFLVVSDRKPENDELIRLGNEQVLKARLSDAQFFDQQDRKTSFADRVGQLSGVSFLKGLGTYADKSHRLAQLVRKVCSALDLDAQTTDQAARAAWLCKADLLTEMVGEFPALQGNIGRIYAARDGEPEAVAIAIEEHYMPRSAEGDLPSTPAGRALSLAEKLDNMTGCFALGLIPTGSADPYALRRQSQAVIRILEESGRHLSLSALAREALQLLPEPHNRSADAVTKMMDFVRDRLFQMSLDSGVPHDLIGAALAAGFDDVVDFRMRIEALRSLSKEDGWTALVAAVERTGNISRAAPDAGIVDPALLTEALEKQLAALHAQHSGEIDRLMAARKYVEASRRYADAFAGPLHEFFEKVFVNVDDMNVRNNRLRLLLHINRLYTTRLADLSQITTGVHEASGRRGG